MKLASTILLGLALIAFTLDLWFVYSTYNELLKPASPPPEARFRQGQNRDGLLGIWLAGNFIHVIGSILFLLSLYLFLNAKAQRKPPQNTATRTLVALANRSVPMALQPATALVFLYQIPFVLLYALYWRAPNPFSAAPIVSATVMTILLVVLVKIHVRKVLIGDPRLELDDHPDLPAHRLSGCVVLPRQTDFESTPISLQLKLYENRMHQVPESVFREDSGPVNVRELYWQIRFNTLDAVVNPFETETSFPFKVDVPAWLPRPWTHTKDGHTIGIEWNIEAWGNFSRTNFSADFPILEIPVSLKQPKDERIRIPSEDVVPLLSEQSIQWNHSNNGRFASITRVRPSMIGSLFFGTLFAAVAVTCMMLLWHQPDLFFLWCFLGSLAMSIAILQKRFAYRVLTVDNDQRTLVFDRIVFGYCYRQVIPRDEFSRVYVQPAFWRIVREDSYSNFEYDIVLLFRRSDDEQIRVARVRYRLVAKALAKALANELGIPMEYRPANSRTKPQES